MTHPLLVNVIGRLEYSYLHTELIILHYHDDTEHCTQ